MILKLKSAFKEMGLGEDEAEVYLVCLKLGPSTVLQIAKKTNIIRATLYKILSRLEAKGLVSQIEKDDRNYQVAEDPKVILERLEEEQSKKKKALDIAKEIVPGLSELAKEYDRPHVRLFEGQKSLVELWLTPTMTTGTKEVLVLLDFDTLFSYLPEKDCRLFMQRRLEKGIKLRILRKRSLKTFQVFEYDEEEIPEKRFLPDDFEIDGGFTVFGDKVAIITTSGEPFGILIESKFFSATMKSIFEKLWDSANQPK